jgi:hypothetical protein
MQLSEIRSRLQDVYGNTLTSEDTFYARIINDAYAKLCALADWWWLETTQVLRFAAPMTTADYIFSVTSNTVAASAADDWLGADYVNGWLYTGTHTYRVLGTAAASVYTIDANYIGTAATIAATFWNDTITLPTAFDHVISVAPRNDPNYKPLDQVRYEDIERHGPDLSGLETETAQKYAVYRDIALDSDQARLRIYPPPDETAEYLMRYVTLPTALSADGDVPLLPVKFHNVLCDMSRLELLKVTGAPADEVAVWEGEVAKGVQRIFSEQYHRGGMKRRFGRWGRKTLGKMPYNLIDYTLGDPV